MQSDNNTVKAAEDTVSAAQKTVAAAKTDDDNSLPTLHDETSTVGEKATIHDRITALEVKIDNLAVKLRHWI